MPDVAQTKPMIEYKHIPTLQK